MLNRYVSPSESIKENLSKSIKESSSSKNTDSTINEGKKAKAVPIDATDAMMKRSKKLKRMHKLNEDIKNSFLETAINTVFDKILQECKAEDYEYNIGHAAIRNFIKEEGYNNIIQRFYNQNIVLSEMARFSDMYSNAYYIMETKNDKDISGADDISFTLDKTVAQDFVDKIKDLVPEKTIKMIRDRVVDSMDDFMIQNSENKMAITDIYNQANEKIAKHCDDSLKEDYTAFAKLKVNAVYDKPTSLLDVMCREMAECVHKNKVLTEQYSGDNGSLDMKRLINDTCVLYTVLEMMNTMQMVDVNGDYLKSVLEDLKK